MMIASNYLSLWMERIYLMFTKIMCHGSNSLAPHNKISYKIYNLRQRQKGMMNNTSKLL